jgi:hypothetical protein
LICKKKSIFSTKSKQIHFPSFEHSLFHLCTRKQHQEIKYSCNLSSLSMATGYPYYPPVAAAPATPTGTAYPDPNATAAYNAQYQAYFDQQYAAAFQHYTALYAQQAAANGTPPTPPVVDASRDPALLQQAFNYLPTAGVPAPPSTGYPPAMDQATREYHAQLAQVQQQQQQIQQLQLQLQMQQQAGATTAPAAVIAGAPGATPITTTGTTAAATTAAGAKTGEKLKHKFEWKTYGSPHWCEYCSEFL